MAVIDTVQRPVAYPFSVLRLLSFCNIGQQSIDLLYAVFYPLLPRYTIAKERTLLTSNTSRLLVV